MTSLATYKVSGPLENTVRKGGWSLVRPVVSGSNVQTDPLQSSVDHSSAPKKLLDTADRHIVLPINMLLETADRHIVLPINKLLETADRHLFYPLTCYIRLLRDILFYPSTCYWPTDTSIGHLP